MCVYVAKKYLAKHIYVCLGGEIPWICMYIAKYLMKKKKRRKKKKKQTRKRNKQMIMIRKKVEKRKNKLSSWKTNMLLKRDDFQLFFEKNSLIITSFWKEMCIHLRCVYCPLPAIPMLLWCLALRPSGGAALLDESSISRGPDALAGGDRYSVELIETHI